MLFGKVDVRHVAINGNVVLGEQGGIELRYVDVLATTGIGVSSGWHAYALVFDSDITAPTPVEGYSPVQSLLVLDSRLSGTMTDSTLEGRLCSGSVLRPGVWANDTFIPTGSFQPTSIRCAPRSPSAAGPSVTGIHATGTGSAFTFTADPGTSRCQDREIWTLVGPVRITSDSGNAGFHCYEVDHSTGVRTLPRGEYIVTLQLVTNGVWAARAMSFVVT